MSSVCFYFEVHQPLRLSRFSVFDIGKGGGGGYFDDRLNREIFEKVARKCYLPTNRLLLELIRRFDGGFKVSFSLTGTFVEYCECFLPELLDSFRELFRTGCVDLIEETYFHSLAGLFDDLGEFRDQVRLHRDMIKRYFGYKPRVFRNTEAIYDNRIARVVADLGYRGIITEGSDRILGWRSPNFLYRAVNCDLCVLLRNYSLSDDVGFRFSASGWRDFPLTAEKYAGWMSGVEGDLINLFMDYETFGEHHWGDTGIFDFLSCLPGEVFRVGGLDFVTVSEAVERFRPVGVVDVPWAVSWADEDRDVSTWLGNDMQRACFEELKFIGGRVRELGDEVLLGVWRRLLTSDHLYYVSTKGLEDGDVHAYFSPYDGPYEGFINFMNVLQDFKQKL